jgi:hypothetical protein
LLQSLFQFLKVRLLRFLKFLVFPEILFQLFLLLLLLFPVSAKFQLRLRFLRRRDQTTPGTV